jgi:hypothetical protein
MKRALIVALACMSLPVTASAEQAGHTMQTGEGLMRMCFGAITVQSLSIMCHNYINGYLDAVASGQRKGQLCFGKGDTERLPPESIIWLKAHPDYMKRPAPEALDRVLSEKFACRK